MSVIILKNIATEGPGTIEPFLRDNGISYRTIEMSGDYASLDREADMADILVIMGGPMSVSESDIYPYIVRETDLAGEFIRKGKKVLGICLGAQIMAKALGARVFAGPQKEIGWYDIVLTEGGVRDPLMKRLAMQPRGNVACNKFRVFHWHGETFDMPEGAEWLAKSDLYPHQSFRYGAGAYAFQFHIEVTKDMIYEWLRNEPVDHDALKRDTEALYEDYSGRATNFYNAFFKGV
jgi:GMP synthase-like glutamine amidotransferase